MLGLCDGDALVCEGEALVCDGAALVCDDGGSDEECDAAASGGGLDVCVGGSEWLAPGEPGLVPADAAGVAGLLEVEEAVHAETETETTTVKVAHAAK